MMRLLKVDSHGQLSLTKNLTKDIPSYAILSHTWATNEEDEVTISDLKDGAGENRAGFAKIQFCAKQAQKDGLEHFWIDTCTIDKSSSSELAEAINSMFKWYKNATKCYVYLSDVSVNNNDSDAEYKWESAFEKSKWFSRGWTLQELIAPTVVEFFSVEGERLGDKKSLEQQIHQITGIAIEALRGERPLSLFDVEERLSWTTRRQTTLEEDTAYCLLGIFDIHMSPIYGEGRQKALDRLRREIKISSDPTSFLATDAPWIVPFERNPNFTGRDTQLADLEEKLFVAKDHTSKIAITGLGGIGKTQLVLELLCRTKKRHKDCLIIWIPATNTESLNQGYLVVARQLEIPGCEDEKTDVKKLVQDHLSKEDTGHWLLVFDNADDVDMWIATPKPDHEDVESAQRSLAPRRLIDYLPKSKRGCIIFTTRDRKVAVKLAQQNIVEVPEMGEEAARDLLKKCLVNPDLVNSNLQDATALLGELTLLPLAIVQAAAYINANGITLADYYRLLLEEKKEDIIDLLSEEFEDNGRYQDVKNPVATTWLISFQQIRQRDPLAAEYLSFMACIDYKDIPQSLLPPAPSRKREMDAIGTLIAYSFISRRPAKLVFDLHRLVHLATKGWLRKEEMLSQWTEKTIMHLEEVFPDNDHMNRSIWRMYLPHARQVLASKLVSKDEEKRIAVMMGCANCLYSDGRWAEAEELWVQVMEIRLRALGAEHPDTLMGMGNLALIYRNQGHWKKAEKLEVQVMEIRLRVFGAEHPDTLISMGNLALTYRDQGQWKKAEKLEVQVMEIRLRVFGAEHPHTLISMGNLALTYSYQGHWKKAEELEVQVMEISSRVLGVEHPDVLISMNNLVLIYSDQGHWKNAEELGVQVMEIMLRVLGAEHPNTLISMNNLAAVLSEQGKYKQAEKIYQQTLELQKRVQGQEHPDTLTSMNNLAGVLSEQGKNEQAEKIYQQTLELRKRVLGQEHPDTLASMNNLAGVLIEQGKYKQAEEMHQQTLELKKRVLGQEHPNTLASMNNLAEVLRVQGKDKQAEEIHQQTLELTKKVLGPEHPSTLKSMNNLAGVLSNQGKYEQAEEIHQQTLELKKRVLGQEHPSTLASMYNLASVLIEQGKYEQAEEIHQQTLLVQTLVELNIG